MKNECDIVKDLLPLYAEGMLSESSVAFVEEHVKNCPGCADALKELKTEKPQSVTAQSDPAAVSAPIKRIKKRVARRVILGIVITAFAALSALVLYRLFKPVAVEYGASELHTREELEYVANDILRGFEKNGSKPIVIRYSGDDMTKMELEYNKERGTVYKDIICFSVTYRLEGSYKRFPGNVIRILFEECLFRQFIYAKDGTGEWICIGSGQA